MMNESYERLHQLFMVACCMFYASRYVTPSHTFANVTQVSVSCVHVTQVAWSLSTYTKCRLEQRELAKE